MRKFKIKLFLSLVMIVTNCVIMYSQNYSNITYRLCTDCPQTENTSQLDFIYDYGNILQFGPLEVTSDYGPRILNGRYNWHNGIDLRPYPPGNNDNHRGTGILSIENGTVEHIKINNSGYKYIVINGAHRYGYGHIFNSSELHL